MSGPLRLLAIDPDRARQAAVGPAFTRKGHLWRFVSDPRKAVAGARQINPNLVVVFGALGSEVAEATLDSLTSDVTWATAPVVLVCEDLADAQFVVGLRTSVVGLVKAPFDPARHVAELEALAAELPSRAGTVSGMGDGATLNRLAEHLRRARRSGQLVLDARTPNEGTATFARGRLEAARYQSWQGLEALVKMVAQPSARFSFTEGAAPGELTGVVIAMEDGTGTDDTLEVVAGVALTEEPLEMKAVPPPAAPPRPAPVLPVAPPTGPSILLVDDDFDLCRMFYTLFTKNGFKVTSARDGVDGFAAAASGEFALVIADLNMPRMDGWGMLRQLRDDLRTRELPVAFLSCHDDYREALKALDAGAQAYFSKGGPLSGLLGQVKKLLVPRETVRGLIDAGSDFDVPLSSVGPQWLLKTLGQKNATCRIEAHDSWAQYQVFVNAGAPVHAVAISGRFRAEGERAFNAFVASRAAEGTVKFGAFPAPQTLGGTADVQLGRAVQTLNENERRMADALLVSATVVDVNLDLYAVYTKVGPKQWLEAARLLCEEKLPPRDIIARLEVSPVDVEEMMKDLMRRGVLTLKKA